MSLIRDGAAADIRKALEDIPDPELPVVSIDELGILGTVTVVDGSIRVELHPTFVACPATDLIRVAVEDRLAETAPGRAAEVRFTFDPPWTSDRVTPAGRAKLAAAGIAPPLVGGTADLIDLDAPVACPFCGSTRTRLDNLFGPTLCRSIRWCPDCRQPFEAMKTI
ncbi:MAG TPA: 1,2-phenylacetyl-CoA epoxidase subunit PaaD [Patescibacteria group bacterium]|nr:1,2-phenylacetyl-CoA epoxidase subunit PaaD [Patescibacteria group bacterium]